MSVLAFSMSSGSSQLILDLLIVTVVVFWLALGYWAYRDARRRIEEPVFVGLATLVGLFPPFIGPLVYMLFRPPEFLDDRRERELEIRAIESRLAAADVTCPVCHADVDPSFLVCPVCTTKLKQACSSCNAPLEPIWQICPYCETPMQMPETGAPPALGTRRATTTARRRTR
ncbi:MAG TPA: zinc ribbon domain-containing protein [Gaiellaceae bacterium]|nr:zinc ribbon domain-containing protein [Gaiellaceae bacterium]